MSQLTSDGINAINGLADRPSNGGGDAPPPPAPEPAPEPTPEPEPELTDPVEDLVDVLEPLTVEETLALVESGEYTIDEVLAAERAGKNRTTVIEALQRRKPPPAQHEES